MREIPLILAVWSSTYIQISVLICILTKFESDLSDKMIINLNNNIINELCLKINEYEMLYTEIDDKIFFRFWKNWKGKTFLWRFLCLICILCEWLQ